MLREISSYLGFKSEFMLKTDLALISNVYNLKKKMWVQIISDKTLPRFWVWGIVPLPFSGGDPHIKPRTASTHSEITN